MTEAAIAAPEATITAPPPAPENATDSVAQETNQPIKTTNEAEPAKVEIVEPKKKTALDSLKAAEAKVNKEEAAKVKPAETVAKTLEKPAEAKLDDKGKPVADVKAEPWREAPKRFNEAEKAEWEKAPDAAKQGIHRAIKELEEGHGKYKEAAAKYEDLKEFDELATRYNTTIKDALSNYVAIDQALQSNNPQAKLEAIEEVLRIAKVDPRQYAAFISKQPADQVATQTSQTINELKAQVQQLTQHIQGLSTNVESQQKEQAKAQLNEWAKDKPHAVRLADQIAWHYQQGLSLDESYAKAVGDAQEFAKSMGFTPPSATPSADNVTELAAHTLKASKSITGAPSPGSHLATQKPSTSIKEAIARAMAQA